MSNKVIIINGKNTYYIDGSVTYISLTQNKTTTIDTEDIPLVWPYRWRARLNRRVWYALGCVRGQRHKPILMHRTIANPPKSITVDHKDHNGLNNCKSNIRLCTSTQNKRNRPPKDGKDYKGIYLDKKSKNWRAAISLNGKKQHLGMFKNIDDAKRAYNTAAQKFYGEFAYLNNISTKPSL
jgi:hypothetical protein